MQVHEIWVYGISNKKKLKVSHPTHHNYLTFCPMFAVHMHLTHPRTNTARPHTSV